MTLCYSVFILFFIASISFSDSETLKTHFFKQPSANKQFHAFRLRSIPLRQTSFSFFSRNKPQGNHRNNTAILNSITYNSTFKYRIALVISLPIGTPTQTQQMVLDTGSQLSWVHCQTSKDSNSAFNPSLSSSFSVLFCNTTLCKPQIPDYTLPTSCDKDSLCYYSYFYADGTLAEGNLVRERITLSNSQTTPPIILGCARNSAEFQGILGLNRGRLSFTSQTGIQKFSYCIPLRRNSTQSSPEGVFLFGENPNSSRFQYVNFISHNPKLPAPYFDRFAYTISINKISIGSNILDIPLSVFLPDAGGAGQTMIDSGTEYTYFVQTAYTKVKEELKRLIGSRLKKDYVHGGSLDLCMDGDVVEIGQLIGDLTLEFNGGVNLFVEKERVFADVGGGVACFGIGSSQLLGVENNIIGNYYQQNLWVEYDLQNSRVGFGKTDCENQF